MRKTRIAGLLSAALVLVAVTAIPAVSQASHRWPVKIKVSNSKPVFHGVLSSKNEACERNRTVVVMKARPGQNKFMGADSSSYNGGWSVDVNRNGRYVIKLLGAGSCGADKVRVAVAAF